MAIHQRHDGTLCTTDTVTAIRDAGNNMGKVDCTQQVDDEDIGQRAKDHRQQPDTEPAIAEVDATDICDDEHVCFLKSVI